VQQPGAASAPEPATPQQAEAPAPSEHHYRQLFEQNIAGVYRVAMDGRILELNQAMAGVLGYTREELVGSSAVSAYFDPADRDVWMHELMRRGALSNWVHKLRRRDGTAVWTLENCSVIADAVTGDRVVLGTAIDITERKALEERLEILAYHDPLTGLANRRMLQEMADKAIARSNREGGRIGMLYVDLVRFKRINDVLGHSAGDQVLREVAHRFRAFVRATDTLARVGGDEFALLLVTARSLDSVLLPAKKMRECLGRPFIVDGQSFHLDARIGVALYPEHGATFDELLSRADLAIHQPGTADGEIAIFRPVETRNRREDLLLEERFRTALDGGEFVLFFQPIYRLPECRATGVEGLTRWQQADGRMVGADQFISVAEQTGLIRQLDRWALRAALRQLREWPAGSLPSWVALNLTPSTFDDPDFPLLVRAVLEEERVSPALLALEVTERLTMRDPSQAARILQDLKDMGLRIVIDDFGRGHSSLAYLMDFPVDAVKIDRFFVGRVGADKRQERLVEGIVALCDGLGIELIAEGVETAAQLDWLEAHGCRFAQGYHLNHPLPAHAIPAVFAGGPPAPPVTQMRWRTHGPA
jgi:diguanylate cyclase (GGDEF)-like protein/PAS domain S-box-containing protein